MPLVNLVVTLIVVGVLLWLVHIGISMCISMYRGCESVPNVVATIAAARWRLPATGLPVRLKGIRVGG